jgi:uncharacterized protein YndB with AHSA1/START domain
MTRLFSAPRQLVFDAFTKPEHIVHWLGRAGDTMSVCEVDLRAGGAWRYVWQLREGGEMGMYGVFSEVAWPQRLVTTENFDEPFFAAMGSGTLNTSTFEESDAGTAVTVTVRYKTRESRDAVLQSGMQGGVNESFDRLDEYLRVAA